jgi:ABC-type nitrate/sulfonate/bicarbonate transport system substrate-binding protein
VDRTHAPRRCRRYALTLALAVLCGLPLAASPGAAQQGAGKTEVAPRTATFLAVNNIFAVPAFVAVENGYWANHGIDVKLKLVASGREVVQALQAGEAQLGGASFGTTTASARASGNMLKGIIPYYNAADYIALASGRAIIARKDRGVVAGDPKTLVGKKIATLAGSTNEVYLREFLARNGIDVAKVQLMSVPVPDMPITLSQGLVDVTTPWEPYTSQSLRELGGNGVEVSRGAASLVADLVGVVANEKYIDANQDFLEQFALGMAEATQFVRQEPQKAGEIATYYLDGLSVEDAVEAIRHATFDPRMSVCTDAGMLSAGNDMVKQGLIKVSQPFKAEDFRDMRVIEKVVAGHPALFADLPPMPTELKDCKGPLS